MKTVNNKEDKGIIRSQLMWICNTSEPVMKFVSVSKPTYIDILIHKIVMITFFTHAVITGKI